MQRTLPWTAALASTALAVAACGSGSTAPKASSAATAIASKAAPATTGSPVVEIRGFAFHPVRLTVAAGTKVTFTNRDQTAHTATSSASAFDSGTLKPGASATITLRRPGTYSYYCQFHAFMRATIIVK